MSTWQTALRLRAYAQTHFQLSTIFCILSECGKSVLILWPMEVFMTKVEIALIVALGIGCVLYIGTLLLVR